MKRDELIALGGVGAKVRELEWNEYTDERGDPDRWDAETLAGTFYGIALLVDGFSIEYDYIAVAKGLDDLEAAKAAAQADYERRVLSALEAPAAGDGEPAFPTWGAEDEAYELGKRDGYESAIQDLDLATGGDGEFKGSTIPGGTVDVPAMKARIVGRTTAPPADAGMREALEQLRKEADSAYCRFLDKMSSKPCLGHEAKISNGTFGVTELEAHRHAKELLGFHRGIYHAIKALTAPGATTKSDGGEQPNATTIAAIEELKRDGGEIGSGYGEYTPVTVRGSTSDPSSTRSEVSVEELADFLDHLDVLRIAGSANDDEAELARALLDQFEIRRK